MDRPMKEEVCMKSTIRTIASLSRNWIAATDGRVVRPRPNQTVAKFERLGFRNSLTGGAKSSRDCEWSGS